MSKKSHLTLFLTKFPNDTTCLEEIKRLRYPQGIPCVRCKIITNHYKLRGRTAYACSWCRHHVYPLSGTIFAKSTTPLRLWFFCMFLMIQTRGKLSAKQIQRELGVTYKTAWRMRQQILHLMKQNHGDLLKEHESFLSVSFFNAFELRVTQKQEL